MPYNYICVHTGCLLSQLSSLDELLTINVILKLAGIAVVSLLPGIVIKKMSSDKQFGKDN